MIGLLAVRPSRLLLFDADDADVDGEDGGRRINGKIDAKSFLPLLMVSISCGLLTIAMKSSSNNTSIGRPSLQHC